MSITRVSNKGMMSALEHFWSRHIDQNSLIIILAALIGALTGIAAELLHSLVVAIVGVAVDISNLATSPYARFALIVPLPFLGVLLSMLVQRYWTAPGFSKSLSQLILALDRRQGSIPISETYTHIISSALSVGFGGSAGLEAPSVLTGAAIGSNISGCFGIDHLTRSILVGCGGAAGISAIFDSPIAGVLFVVEALLPEFNVSAMVPLLVASAVSSVVTNLRSGNAAFFMSRMSTWNASELLPMFLCGVVCALIGAFVIRSTAFVKMQLNKHFCSPWTRLAVGGALLCLLLAFFPALRGQGYIQIEKLLLGDESALTDSPFLLSSCPPLMNSLLLLLACIFLKSFVSGLTIDSGGDGGIFAPTMFIGAFTGYTFARLLNISGLVTVSETNFTALGMCGVFTSVMRSPLTGIFLIAETTGGYIILVPLMIVSSISWCMGRLFEPESIYRRLLVQKKLVTDDQDRARLRRIQVSQCIVPAALHFKPDDNMEFVMASVEQTRTKLEAFPVITPQGELVGMLTVEKILTAMFDLKDGCNILVSSLMDPPLGLQRDNDDLDSALTAMETYAMGIIPVVSAKDGAFLGTICKGDIFERYMVKA